MKQAKIIFIVLAVVLLCSCQTKSEVKGSPKPKSATQSAISEKEPENPNDLKVTNAILDKAKPCHSILADYWLPANYSALEKRADYIVEGYFSKDATQDIKFYYNIDVKKNIIEDGSCKNTFAITKVLKGNKDIKEAIIHMGYYVVEEKGQYSVIYGSQVKPMRKGDYWLMFLTKDEKTNLYYITGDFTGRYPIPSKEQISDVKNNKKVRGVSKSSFGMYDEQDVREDEQYFRQIIKRFYINK